MKTFKPYAASLAAALAIGLLAGCAGDPTRSEAGSEPAPAAATSPAPRAAEPVRDSAPAPAPARRQVREEPAPPIDEITGIVACDDYLASYMSCHRVIGTYEPDSLQSRYDSLRASLLRDAKDPARRTEVEARCSTFAAMMKDALNGRECLDTDAASAAIGFEDTDEDADLEK